MSSASAMAAREPPRRKSPSHRVSKPVRDARRAAKKDASLAAAFTGSGAGPDGLSSDSSSSNGVDAVVKRVQQKYGAPPALASPNASRAQPPGIRSTFAASSSSPAPSQPAPAPAPAPVDAASARGGASDAASVGGRGAGAASLRSDASPRASLKRGKSSASAVSVNSFGASDQNGPDAVVWEALGRIEEEGRDPVSREGFARDVVMGSPANQSRKALTGTSVASDADFNFNDSFSSCRSGGLAPGTEGHTAYKNLRWGGAPARAAEAAAKARQEVEERRKDKDEEDERKKAEDAKKREEADAERKRKERAKADEEYAMYEDDAQAAQAARRDPILVYPTWPRRRPSPGRSPPSGRRGSGSPERSPSPLRNQSSGEKASPSKKRESNGRAVSPAKARAAKKGRTATPERSKSPRRRNSGGGGGEGSGRDSSPEAEPNFPNTRAAWVARVRQKDMDTSPRKSSPRDRRSSPRRGDSSPRRDSPRRGREGEAGTSTTPRSRSRLTQNALKRREGEEKVVSGTGEESPEWVMTKKKGPSVSHLSSKFEQRMSPRTQWERSMAEYGVSFMPRISEHSRALAKGLEDDTRSLYTKLYRDGEQREILAEKLRKEAEERELKQCTFRPQINTTAATVASPQMDVVERMQERHKASIERKDEEKNKIRKEMHAAMKAECLFSPRINKYVRPESSPLSPRMRMRPRGSPRTTPRGTPQHGGQGGQHGAHGGYGSPRTPQTPRSTSGRSTPRKQSPPPSTRESTWEKARIRPVEWKRHMLDLEPMEIEGNILSPPTTPRSEQPMFMLPLVEPESPPPEPIPEPPSTPKGPKSILKKSKSEESMTATPPKKTQMAEPAAAKSKDQKGPAKEAKPPSVVATVVRTLENKLGKVTQERDDAIKSKADVEEALKQAQRRAEALQSKLDSRHRRRRERD